MVYAVPKPRPDDATIAAHVLALIDEHPDARVSALDPHTLTDLPGVLDALGVRPGQRVEVMAQLARVVVDDQALALSHSFLVAEEGAAVDRVRLVDGTVADMGLYDLRAGHGAFIGVTVPVADDPDGPAGPQRGPRLPARVAHVRIGPLGEILTTDDASVELLGWDTGTVADLGGAFELVHPEDRKALLACFLGAQAAPDRTDRARVRVRRADGTHLWTELAFHHHPGGDSPCTDIEMVDISLEMAAHEQLHERERLLDRLTNSLPLGVFQVDRRRAVIFTNDTLCALTGVDGPVDVDDVFATVVAEDRAPLADAIDRALRLGEDQDLEVRIAPAPATADRICALSFRALADDRGAVTGAIVCVLDVTAPAMARADLETRVTLDPLTRSLNRDGIMAALRRCLGESDDNGADPSAATPTTVIYIDLDGFKQVNDTFGHGEGDHLLRLTVERMRTALREDDLVGRIGGDEFVAICPGIGETAEALAIANRVAAVLARPPTPGEHLTRASVGVVIGVPGDGRGAGALLAAGDTAMYRSKRAGVGRPVLFDPAWPDERPPDRPRG
jgi:diguanylate cyclase (GGDEF)-like protein